MYSDLSCPFCASPCVNAHQDRRRDYYHCPKCLAVHVPAAFHLNSALEKAEYDKHENDPDDQSYRRFFSRFFDPLCERIAPEAEGLDFGCGPGPALVSMLEETGRGMEKYDLYYYPDKSVLQKQYDFVTATEVVEHLADPLKVLDTLWAMLKPGGVLGLMTKRVIDVEAFKTWHYKNDPTHIVFFHEATFDFIAERWACDLELIGNDVAFLRKTTMP
ncbi:class I SAM-dependent methyltransferase [Pseudomaricurvus sp.]|uniref:class I SAM-dependent methyltransferase n=1 Tax=Pseudomaricurvus sp. TaxID=2004510 RepID=UPI003F6AFBA2